MQEKLQWQIREGGAAYNSASQCDHNHMAANKKDLDQIKEDTQLEI